MMDFSDIRVTIIGDVMLDKYIHGNVNRISPEAPVPILDVEDVRKCLGGAGNVATNIRHLGGQVSLVGIIGDDDAGKTIRDLVTWNDINDGLIERSIPTIVKTRLIGNENQQMLRLDRESYIFQNEKLKSAIELMAVSMAKWADIVVFSDYDKGTIIKSLITKVKNNVNVPIIADPKYQNFWNYKDITVLKPNRKEVENAFDTTLDSHESLAEAGTEILSRLNLDAVLITRGENGMFLLEESGDITDISAENHHSVYDVTGAGDTVCAVLALGIASGMDIPTAAKLANTAAGISVSKHGTGNVSVSELKERLKT